VRVRWALVEECHGAVRARRYRREERRLRYSITVSIIIAGAFKRGLAAIAARSTFLSLV
jgi:hypothetical protein